MVTIRNLTKQGLEIIFKDGQQYSHYWLDAAASVTVPSDFITDTISELTRRRVLQLKKNN
jgi:hypothetical protein